MTTSNLFAPNSDTATNFADSLEQTIREAIVEARQACQVNGDTSSACAVAWDIVEELQAECSHRRQSGQAKQPFEQYCQNYPDAIECRLYDV